MCNKRSRLSSYKYKNSGSQQVGRDPLLGCVHLLLGRLNLCFSTIIVVNGLPNCVVLNFVGRQLQNVENHWFKALSQGRPIFDTALILVF